jgi:hypothetical protein
MPLYSNPYAKSHLYALLYGSRLSRDFPDRFHLSQGVLDPVRIRPFCDRIRLRLGLWLEHLLQMTNDRVRSADAYISRKNPMITGQL